MMRYALSLSISAFAMVSVQALAAAKTGGDQDYVHEPMPPGVQVVMSELEGPVFADAQGHTLYKWPKDQLRNGDAGEIEFKPTCDNEPHRENLGFMSPYPGGLELPEADARPACTAVWPPLIAPADAKEIGKFKPTDRPDGRKQWTYEGWSLYTSALDKRPGDTLGGSAMFHPGESGAHRKPVTPPASVPSQFMVRTTMSGRMVTQRDGWSVYSYDGDGRNKSNCFDACLDGWQPVLAADYARPLGEWTTFERAPGIHQWAFRGKPVYRHLEDGKIHSQDGADMPRWHNVYMQEAPQPPKSAFIMKDTLIGVVLADTQGKTVYRYTCTDDGFDQQACDYPAAPQAYRFTVCGGGDPERCVKTFPYVIAPAGAKSGNMTWGTMYIDPKTGKETTANHPGALNVWTFRSRPVYTFAGSRGYGDVAPEDIKANNWGEFNGSRNGFKVVTYRDLFSNRDE